MLTVSIIGCGNIGSELAYFLDTDKRFTLSAVNDVNDGSLQTLLSKIKSKPRIVSLHEAISKSDLIIEAANKEVVKELLNSAALDRAGKKLLVLSTAGLTENFSELPKLKHCKVYVPEGAIAGLNAIKACAGNIHSLELKTTKPAASLQNAPFIKKNKMALADLKQKTKIFEGSLKEAIQGFPQNINVAAGLYLASQFDDLKIQIIADPKTKFNTHEVKCKGSFGTINTITKNHPSKNPRTSYLAILSAIATLKGIAGNIKIAN
jgi:aspartate dehydrogenase